jgi:hypothetical protein
MVVTGNVLEVDRWDAVSVCHFHGTEPVVLPDGRRATPGVSHYRLTHILTGHLICAVSCPLQARELAEQVALAAPPSAWGISDPATAAQALHDHVVALVEGRSVWFRGEWRNAA